MQKEKVAKRTPVMTMEEIVGKEAGTEAKEKIRKAIADQNAQVAVELVTSTEPDEEKKPVVKKKTIAIKAESVQVTTKIIKPRAKSAKVRTAKKPTKATRPKSAVGTAKAPKSAVKAGRGRPKSVAAVQSKSAV